MKQFLNSFDAPTRRQFVERIMIQNRSVRVVLPGETGDLFKIDDGTFPDL